MKFLMSKRLLALVVLLLVVILLAACGSSVAEPAASDDMGEMNHDDEMDHDGSAEHDGEHDHGDESGARIPNEGNSVQILEPADGAIFAQGEDVVVQVAFAEFAYGEDGNHWHIYLNGSSYGMVVGLVTSETVRGLEPGEYELVVVMANGDHIEYEDGDTIHITVEE